MDTSPAQTHPTVAFLQLEAWLAWPGDNMKDHAARSRFLAVAGGYGAERQREVLQETVGEVEEDAAVHALAAWDDLYQRNGGLRMVLHAPPLAEVVSDYQHAAHVARQAGRILDWAVRLHLDPRTADHVSVNLAKAIVAGLLSRRIRSAVPMETSQVPIDRAWAMRRCVAGYAAAVGRFRATVLAAGDGRGNQMPVEISAAEMTQVLRLGASLTSMATTIIPRRRRDPIVPVAELSVPPFAITAAPVTEIDFAPLPDEVLLFINTARKRPIKDYPT